MGFNMKQSAPPLMKDGSKSFAERPQIVFWKPLARSARTASVPSICFSVLVMYWSMKIKSKVSESTSLSAVSPLAASWIFHVGAAFATEQYMVIVHKEGREVFRQLDDLGTNPFIAIILVHELPTYTSRTH
jgi:hypothetical protein